MRIFLLLLLLAAKSFSSIEQMPYTFDPDCKLTMDDIDLLIENNSFDHLPDEKAIYKQIKDIKHPTYKDYRKLEKYFRKGSRPYFRYLDSWYVNRLKKFRFTPNKRNIGKIHKYCFGNSSPLDREYCIVTYTSCKSGRDFNGAVRDNIISTLQSTGYNGHFLWQEGGWPNLDRGSLHLSHVPYSWKAPLIRQVYLMGYRKILWVDCSVFLKNPKRIFTDFIEKDGYLLSTLRHNCDGFGGPMLNKYFDITTTEAINMRQFAATIIGFNFHNEKIKKLFTLWYKAHLDFIPMCNKRMEQSCLSVLFHKLGLTANNLQDVDDNDLFAVKRR